MHVESGYVPAPVYPGEIFQNYFCRSTAGKNISDS